jgi:hypothetical protein
MTTFDLRSERLNFLTARLADVLGRDMGTVTKDEFRLLLDLVTRLTPPKSLAQGRKAVSRDFKRANQRFDPGAIQNERLRDIVRQRDLPAFEAFLAQAGVYKGWRVMPFDKEHHKSLRDRRGNVRRHQLTFVLEVAGHKRREKELHDRVGRQKAAWGPALVAAGGKLPGWVSRHSNPEGSVHARLTGDKPFMVGINFAVGIGEMRRTLQSAVRIRERAMAKRIDHLLKGHGRDFTANQPAIRKS